MKNINKENFFLDFFSLWRYLYRIPFTLNCFECVRKNKKTIFKNDTTNFNQHNVKCKLHTLDHVFLPSSTCCFQGRGCIYFVFVSDSVPSHVLLFRCNYTRKNKLRKKNNSKEESSWNCFSCFNFIVCIYIYI